MPQAKRSNIGIQITESMPDIPFMPSGTPAGRTRSKGKGAASPAVLTSKDRDVLMDFLRGLAGPADEAILDTLSQEEINETLARALPKLSLLAARSLINSSQGAGAEGLKRTIARQEKRIEEYAAAEQEWQAEREKGEQSRMEQDAKIKALLDRIAVTRETLRKMEEDHRQGTEEAEERGYQEGLQAFPTTEEGVAFLAKYKANLLASPEFLAIVDDKNLDFFEKGFDACKNQFAGAGYPPEGSSTDFLDCDAAIDTALKLPATPSAGTLPGEVSPPANIETDQAAQEDPAPEVPATIPDSHASQEEVANPVIPLDED